MRKYNFIPVCTPFDENSVDKVKAIGGFIFDWRKDMMEKHDFTPDQQSDDAGLIAQEVQKVMPAAIKRAPFDHSVLLRPNVVAFSVNVLSPLFTKSKFSLP
mgnify:CR=1 FL=1